VIAAPRRIALVTSSFAPYVGGVEEHVRNAAKVLSARGFEVEVWTVARDGVPQVRQVDGVTVRDLPCPLPARSPASLARFVPGAARALVSWMRAARAFRPDILHVQCYGPNGTYAAAVSRLLQIPLVISSHGETLGDEHSIFDRSAFAGWSLRRSLRRAAVVTGCSKVVVEDLEQRFALEPERGHVVYNGVDLAEQAVAAQSAPPEGTFFLGVGRLVRVKGFDQLVEAFAVAELPAEVSLVIGGDGPERDALLRRAGELGIGDRVHLPGRLTRGDVAEHMAKALAVVVPSRFEAFGITALEAWRAGAPAVVTTHGGGAEFIVDGVNGLLVDPADARALAAALRRLVADSALKSRLTAGGATAVKGFSWDATVDRYEAVYAEAATSLQT
jgi:glycosyltransferase involved in cell wall biosynthesis